MGLSEINENAALDYRIYRMTGKKPGEKEPKPDENAPTHKPPARSTLHDEVITLRMVLKSAVRKKWIAYVPDLSPPYRGSVKIERRPWFSLEEYKRLYKATSQYARSPQRDRFRWDAEQLHDQVVFLANTGLRPDEAKNLQHRDIQIVKDQATSELILEIEVRGKRGAGYCKSMPGAVKAYQRLLNRGKWVPQGRKQRNEKERARRPEPPPLIKPEPTDLVFPGDHNGLFNKILEQENLKFIEILQKLNKEVKEKYPPTPKDLARHPSMHRTDTLDMFTVAYGEIYLVSDTDETLLKPGDTAIVQGVNHVWSNRSDKPRMIVGVMVHAKPYPKDMYPAEGL
jgi:integrase